MNGTFTAVLLWVIGGLVALAHVLFATLLKTHADRDNERFNELRKTVDEKFDELDEEILRIRNRLHDLTSMTGKVDQWQRFKDEDQKDD